MSRDVESVESECDMWPRGLEYCGILWESASRFMDHHGPRVALLQL